HFLRPDAQDAGVLGQHVDVPRQTDGGEGEEGEEEGRPEWWCGRCGPRATAPGVRSAPFAPRPPRRQERQGKKRGQRIEEGGWLPRRCAILFSAWRLGALGGLGAPFRIDFGERTSLVGRKACPT